MTQSNDTKALDEIQEALRDPAARIALSPTFTHGMAVQVWLKRKKVGPLLLPDGDDNVSHVLYMVGQLTRPPKTIEDQMHDVRREQSLLQSMIIGACPGAHSPKWHRDHKPPWCPHCGRTASGELVQP